eukprot:2923489-Rhodomonas_salina.2
MNCRYHDEHVIPSLSTRLHGPPESQPVRGSSPGPGPAGSPAVPVTDQEQGQNWVSPSVART